MSQGNGRRRRASSTSAHGAADEHNEHAAAVTDEQVLAALATLRVWLVGATTPTTYDQDRRPDGAGSRDAFLRRHRDRVRAGVEGWTRTGQARVVTAAAWAFDVQRETERARARATTVPPTPVNDVDDELDRELGIRTRRAAR